MLDVKLAAPLVGLVAALAAVWTPAAAQQPDGALWITVDASLIEVEPGRNYTFNLTVTGQHRCPLSPPPKPRVHANPSGLGDKERRVWSMDPGVVEPTPVRVEGESPPLYRVNETFVITLQGGIRYPWPYGGNVTWTGSSDGHSTSNPCSASGYSWSTAHAGRMVVRSPPAEGANQSDDWEPRVRPTPLPPGPVYFDGRSDVPGDARAVAIVMVLLAAVGVVVSRFGRR
ncbi:MAG TPA: hypothetical protein VI818_02850 [Candidatus Thermoplasmatota archaeon]|nr:hypothetical protein [Candidatus Thermoplasmatota archaeon]